MKFIQAGKFRAECFKIMDDINSTCQEVVITKRDIPIVKLCPIEKKDKTLFGKMKGTVKIVGNLLEPIDEEWDANN